MDLLQITLARLNVQSSILALDLKRALIKKRRPERTDLIEELDQLIDNLTQSFTCYKQLEEEHRELVRINHSLHTDLLKQDKELNRLKDIEKNIDL